MPNSSQTARTARRLAIETGWPPPELLVTVTITSGTSLDAALLDGRAQGLEVDVALERVLERPGRAPRRTTQVDAPGALVLDVGAGGVEVGVVGHDVALVHGRP